MKHSIIIFLSIAVALATASCSKSDKKGKASKVTSATTITTQATTTDPAITTTAVTTTTLADPVNKSDFKLDKTSVYIEVGEQDTPMVQAYPDGTYEADERWSTGDASIATVDSYGHIKGISPGVCYVTLRSAADPKQEVMIKVTVRGEGTDTSTPQSNKAEAPEPPVYDTEGLTYIEGVLIANKSYSLPATFAPGLETICYSQFQALSGAAAKEGLSIYLQSGYRSYHDQEIIYDEPEMLPFVYGDKNRIRQVFINIIDNAVKYSSPGDTVTIKACEKDGRVIVSVADTGCGIKESDLAKVKTKFYKANHTRRGSGIGLAVADEIIAMHGGTMDIASEGEGKGTTVTISLPAKAGNN